MRPRNLLDYDCHVDPFEWAEMGFPAYLKSTEGLFEFDGDITREGFGFAIKDAVLYMDMAGMHGVTSSSLYHNNAKIGA